MALFKYKKNGSWKILYGSTINKANRALCKDENLGDLPDTAQARQNLNVDGDVKDVRVANGKLQIVRNNSDQIETRDIEMATYVAGSGINIDGTTNTISVKSGSIQSNNDGIVNGGAIYNYVTRFEATGAINSTDTKAVSGKTVNTALANYIPKDTASWTAANKQTWSTAIAVGSVANNATTGSRAVSGKTVYDYISTYSPTGSVTTTETKAVSGKKIKAAIDSAAAMPGSLTKGAAGYVKFPNGFIIQWGATASSSHGDFDVKLPIKFPTKIVNIQLTQKGGHNSEDNIWATPGSGSNASNLQYIRIHAKSGETTAGVWWMVIGY